VTIWRSLSLLSRPLHFIFRRREWSLNYPFTTLPISRLTSSFLSVCLNIIYSSASPSESAYVYSYFFISLPSSAARDRENPKSSRVRERNEDQARGRNKSRKLTISLCIFENSSKLQDTGKIELCQSVFPVTHPPLSLCPLLWHQWSRFVFVYLWYREGRQRRDTGVCYTARVKHDGDISKASNSNKTVSLSQSLPLDTWRNPFFPRYFSISSGVSANNVSLVRLTPFLSHTQQYIPSCCHDKRWWDNRLFLNWCSSSRITVKALVSSTFHSTTDS